VLENAIKLEPSHFLSRLNLAKAGCRLGNAERARQAMLGPPSLTQDELRVALEDGEFVRACRVIVGDVKHRLAKLGSG